MKEQIIGSGQESIDIPSATNQIDRAEAAQQQEIDKQNEYNTEKVSKARARLNDAMNKVAKANVKAIEIGLGAGVGGAFTGEMTGMIAGYNFAKSGTNAIDLQNKLRREIHGIKGAKELASKTPMAKNARIREKTNNVINAYNNLQAEKNWNNDRMLDETERVLNIKDVSKIKDEKLRTYAETVQDLRTEYEGKYQVPNDVVLDRVTKIQSGEVKVEKQNKRQRREPREMSRAAQGNSTNERSRQNNRTQSRYTRKPRTHRAPRTIDRNNGRNN